MIRRLVLVLVLSPALLHAGNEGLPKERDFKDVSLKELGIEAVPPVKDAKTGFVVGGKNSTETIRTLTEMNGLKIATLEKVMRPKALSKSGFLGADEKLLDVLAMDNDYVLGTLGLTHQELARHMRVAGAIAKKHASEPEAWVPLRYHGRKFRIKLICARGFQDSPFEDGTKANCNATLENLDAGKALVFSLLVPEMVERYGFYEGKGTPYRVEPRKIVEVFDFLKEASSKK